MNPQEVIQILIRKEIEYDLAKRKLFAGKIILKILQKQLSELENIKNIILEIAKQSKEEIKVYIENIVTNALQLVYGDEFSFEMHIEQKRDQEEIYFFLNKGGTLLEIRKDLTSGGSRDIVSLGLKIAIWSLTNSEPILLLDEPMKSLGNKSELGIQILKQFSKEFNIQILLITHNEDIINLADKVFKIGE